MGADAILFIGPSLPECDPAESPGFERRPPVAQGDVYRATLEKPRAIGIVDGYFHGVPAVWHKEILWAMTQGIHVFGAASMGALRAAELHPFGMRGVGRIFEAYRNGTLTDDDEVALTHGPEDLGYPGLSEPMVISAQPLTALFLKPLSPMRRGSNCWHLPKRNTTSRVPGKRYLPPLKARPCEPKTSQRSVIGCRQGQSIKSAWMHTN